MASHRYGIFYDGTEACFYARHPDMVKQVMIKDFDHFTDFGFMPDLIQKMSINDFGLANTTGEHWKSLKGASKDCIPHSPSHVPCDTSLFQPP